ncbi:penicillin-binding protein 1A [Gloeocapsa sp. BRSZ]|uniref:transglycosylase domain-containing protein n=1 Tax=Gloeocapsa sp. PCC 7428 TaxID=1173026 RepID=UPI0002A5EEC3|nr:penicillin-binding protein 1A [Gloeocapsa sp. PCC 7428]AFZ30943.1 penicillin-binding protein, 1A family [Gloeocapsa sp. PCC 7428]
MSSSIVHKKQQRGSSPSYQFVKEVGQVTGGTLLAITMLTSAVVAGGLIGLATSFRNLPDVRALRNYFPSETSYIYDIKGRLLASIHGEANREVVPLDRISPDLKRAVMAIEDSHFYYHHGINVGSVGRALLVNWQRGAVAEGGSTVSMQLARNIFLTQERKFSRKVAEAVLAVRLEQVLSKEEILELYLNQVYWGHNNYGVQTAARTYFNKSAANLNLAEAAMMAGLIQAPEQYSPFNNMERAKQRQEIVLNRMLQLGWITPEEEAAARNTEIKLGRIRSFQGSAMPYVTNAAAQELAKRFGRDAVLKGGMRVQTTVDADMQRMAEETVTTWHKRIRAQGVNGDQMALVAVDPRTQFIKALVGGVDPRKSEFNRATQAQRQPGSAFKPFVYYAAFASGKYTPNSIVEDTPVSYNDGSAERYIPKNYDNSFQGPMSIRRALEVSRNIPAIKIGQAVGLNKVIEICRVLGINSPMEPVISLPLGAIGVTPLEMASAYATFANYGWHSPPTAIVRVSDSSGNVLLDNTPKPQLVLDPWAAASLNSVMQGVITNGTGRAAQLDRQAAGKTGTTSSERDIWFVGYVPQLATAVWVGNDNYRPLGKGSTGGGFVAPVWRDFMQKALKDQRVEYFRSPSQFQRPSAN